MSAEPQFESRDILPCVRLAVEVEIPSDVRFIEGVVELVTRRCQEMEYTARQCSLNVPVALTEALSNAILRGNEERIERRVQVRADVDYRRLVVEVEDEGEGFDLESSIEDPTLPENLLREDGRGLFLMSRLMDRIERFTAAGNTVRMTLHRHE
jgi:serine/threonine-protein kinase RsbW